MVKISLLGSCIVLTLSACSKSDDLVVETTPQETVNEFAINQSIQVKDNYSSNENNLELSGADIASDAFNNSEDSQVETLPEGVYEESVKAELDESIAVQESEEYEAYINSDERIEIYMNYDRTEGDKLVLYYMLDESEKVENTLKISEVIEGIDALEQGDEVCVICNGAFSDDGTEFIKVYQVINITTKEEEIIASEEAAFEAEENE